MGTTPMFVEAKITLASITVAVLIKQGDHISDLPSDLPFVGCGGLELVDELDV